VPSGDPQGAPRLATEGPLEPRLRGEDDPGEEVDRVVRDVRPIVVAVLDTRPTLAERELDERQRNDGDVDEPRGVGREARRLPREPREERHVEDREREEIRDEPGCSHVNCSRVREQRRQEGEETLVERWRHGESRRNDRPKRVVHCRRDPQPGVVEIEPAAQLEELDGGPEEDDARHEGGAEPRDPLPEVGGSAPNGERDVGRPAREREEQRHVPEADEAADDQHHERKVAVADVVEGRRIESHGP
jgi:hypothetical protein